MRPHAHARRNVEQIDNKWLQIARALIVSATTVATNSPPPQPRSPILSGRTRHAVKPMMCSVVAAGAAAAVRQEPGKKKLLAASRVRVRRLVRSCT